MQEKILGKREISLALLIGCAILVSTIGGDIMYYFVNMRIPEFITTVLLTIILFIIIIKNVRILLAVNTR